MVSCDVPFGVVGDMLVVVASYDRCGDGGCDDQRGNGDEGAALMGGPFLHLGGVSGDAADDRVR